MSWNPMGQKFDPEPVTLAGFLLARIAEDEAAWSQTTDLVTRPDFAKLSRHMLAECEAKRRTVELLSDEQPLDQGHWEGHGADERWVADHAPELLRLLALPYAGHPDWREEWRP
jgi:hypothetical protein